MGGGRRRGGGRSIFDMFTGGGAEEDPNGPEDGADLQYDLPISFEESIFGTTKTIEIPNEKDCPDCHGTGAAAGTRRETCKQCGGTGYVTTRQAFFQMRQPCPVCRGAGTVVRTPCRTCAGTGRVKDRATIQLHVPRGVETGTHLRVAGRGEPGMRGGRAGDLHVVVHVRESDLFERQGDDLLVEAPVPPDVAALGGDVEVPTPEGTAKIRIAPGTPDGKLFRLRGKGAPLVNGRGAGDLIVRVAVEVETVGRGQIIERLEDEGAVDGFVVEGLEPPHFVGRLPENRVFPEGSRENERFVFIAVRPSRDEERRGSRARDDGGERVGKLRKIVRVEPCPNLTP